MIAFLTSFVLSAFLTYFLTSFWWEKKRKKVLENLRDSEDWQDRRQYYRKVNSLKEWRKAEDDKCSVIRREAFQHTGNWEKAEADKDGDIRLEAHSHTHNWRKGENDKDWYVAIESFKKTGNWEKAKKHPNLLVCIEASEQTESLEDKDARKKENSFRQEAIINL